MAKLGNCAICGRYGRLGRQWCLAHYQRWRQHGDPMKGGGVEIAEWKLRPLVLKDDHALVPLSQGLVAVIDLRDAEEIGRRNWHAVEDGRTFYALDGAKNKLHNVILGHKDGHIVDHEDGDGLNNRRSNLRFATASQNQFNKRLNRNNTSGFKGVSYAAHAPGEKKWRAKITVERKYISLGYYLTPELAAAAYDKAAQRLFGEFACANARLAGG